MERAFRSVVRRSMSCAQLRSTLKPPSASEIRKIFLDYFCEENKHLYIRSSPVFSLKDPTLAFTNAGMNQFKDVFLGLEEPASRRVANCQKCIRIGGAHNDLDQVGQDGSHHTFFEMLGNWSFGDYFKEDACRMSWNLLTQEFKIPPERLYVTYFAGDQAMGLGPDVEVQEIWRQIGVKNSHILGFGTKENFWSASPVSPCGPCTEIHYDHVEGRTDAAKLVNSGRDEVTELWNLVFTQFNWTTGGELITLKKHFVDTGMGLERLVAVLQGKTANYDTDLFLPLFEVIRRETGHSGYTGKYEGNAIDCGYRVLADHSRMITVALSDGMIPNHQAKLRTILRKSFTVAQKIFGAEPSLLKVLSSHVAEILSDTYPEIGRNLNKIHNMIDEEIETTKINKEKMLEQYNQLKESFPSLYSMNVEDFPQTLRALQYFKKKKVGGRKQFLDETDFFTLYDTFGVPAHVTEQLALQLGVSFNKAAFLEFERSKKAEETKRLHEKYFKMRQELTYLNVLEELEEKKISPTLDYFKYDYTADENGEYTFNTQETTIQAILKESELLDEITAEEVNGCPEIGLILDKTQLFSQSENQSTDWGTLTIGKEIIFDIRKVRKIKHYVIHFGTFRNIPRHRKVSVQNVGILELDGNRRLSIMRNHTALHLVNAFLKKELDVAVEKDSLVAGNKLYLHCMVYKKSINDTQKLEQFVKDFIKNGVSVNRKVLNLSEFQALNDVVFIPGENIVSRDIPVIEINCGAKLYREYCRGTHLLNTSHLQDFLVDNFQKGSNRVLRIVGVTGENCGPIRQLDLKLQEKWSSLQIEIKQTEDSDLSKLINLESKAKELLRETSVTTNGSYTTRTIIGAEVLKTRQTLTSSIRSNIRNLMRKEILQGSDRKYLVHCLEHSWEFNLDDLEEVAAECPEKPLMMLFKYKDSVTIQCIVPPKFVSHEFSARHWLTESTLCLNGVAKCKPCQDPKSFFYLQDRKATQDQIKQIMKTAINMAKKYIHFH